ncbi:MAG: HlyD family type I secretion periplasmic adaptor subunit [Motiliproteus sp.]
MAESRHVISNAIFLTIIGFVVVLFSWAAFAEIDEVTRSEGVVVPSSQTKVVQSFDGGILRELIARVGDPVKQGQVLAVIDSQESEAERDKAEYEWMSLTATQERLVAQSSVTAPVFKKVLYAGYPQIPRDQMRLYQAQKNELDMTITVIQARLAQRQQELISSLAEQKKLSRLMALARREEAILKPLVENRIEPELSLLKVEQTLTSLDSDSQMVVHKQEQVRQSIQELSQEVLARRQSFRVQALTELAEVSDRLVLVEKTLPSLREKVNRSAIVSPINGIVNQVMINTLGGVIQPVMTVFEVVPVDDKLVIEAKVLPEDVAFVVPGQSARVKITAYDFAQYGAIDGKVVTVSPDAITEKDNSTYYIARIETQASTLDAYGESYPILPGIQTQVDFISGRRSVLEYMVKPMLKIRDNAFSER